jgi:hypothetical protein
MPARDLPTFLKFAVIVIEQVWYRNRSTEDDAAHYLLKPIHTRIR